MGVARFMASPVGRLVRIIAGIILIYVGLWIMGGAGGWVVAAVGLVPLLAGLLDVCLLAPVLGAPFRGGDIRGTA